MLREKKLIFNTLLFAISNFGSKALSFFLVPFYTAILSTEQYGTIDLILTSCSLLVPIITVSIADAVLRFAMDETNNRSDVFTTGTFVVALGGILGVFLVYALCVALGLRALWGYVFAVLLLNCFYLLSSQFCRAISKTVQFAIGGIIQTFSLIVSNIVFLLFFSLGIKGYLIALMISYFVAGLFLFFSCELHIYLKGKIDKRLFINMIKYATPLIPNTILWWVMNASDKYFVSYHLGKSYNGLYAVAYKFPSIISVISTVFFQAWQLSAIEESEAKDKSEYYSMIFQKLFSVLVVGLSVILLVLKPVFSIWTNDDYYIAWRYSPALLFAAMFMCFSSFWGSNLIAVKKTGAILRSAFCGGMINILLNALLIPKNGLHGAAFATFMAFFITWIVRYFEGQKYFNIRMNFSFVFVNAALLLVQCAYLDTKYYLPVEVVLCSMVVILNRTCFISFMCGIKSMIKKSFGRGK